MKDTQQAYLARHGWYEKAGKYHLDKLPERLSATAQFEELSLEDAITIQGCIDKLRAVAK